jgi:uncharacterized protein (TIGR00369 family)
MHQPRDPEYYDKVVKSFNQQAVMGLVQATIESLKPGEIEIEFPYQANLTQQNGFIHAGILSTVMDSACGYAAYSLMPVDASVLTVEFKINLLAPASGERFRSIAAVKKSGRTLSLSEAELYAITGDQRKLVATMSGTLMAVYHVQGQR